MNNALSKFSINSAEVLSEIHLVGIQVRSLYSTSGFLKHSLVSFADIIAPHKLMAPLKYGGDSGIDVIS